MLEPLEIAGTVTVTVASELDLIHDKDATGLGEAVSAMDLDDDGASDLVIAAPWTDYPEGDLAGTVYVISYPFRHRFYLPLIRN